MHYLHGIRILLQLEADSIVSKTGIMKDFEDFFNYEEGWQFENKFLFARTSGYIFYIKTKFDILLQ